MSDINEKSNFVFEFQPVTKLFEEQVRLHPDKCAVASSKESFTYAQLNERANRIANSLIEKGVGCEKIVGVVLERCCDFYAVRQGILKAGGAFAVAAPDYPMTVYSSFLKMQEFPLLSPQRRSRRSARSCFPGFPVRCFCLKNCWKTQMPGTRIPRLRNMIFATVFTPPVPRENQKVL